MTKRALARAELSRAPQNIDAENWYYETRFGLLFVHEVRMHGVWNRTDQVLIPWRLILRSLKRRNAATRRQPRPKRGGKA